METPVLFLIFNRPNTTRKVFAEIRKVRPKYFFIAADGPRTNNKEDEKLCKEVREIVSNIDWKCQVKTLIRDKNIGCDAAVKSSINWFFEHVDRGIILEDDCIPNSSFFSFCELMLDVYKNDTNIGTISGNNYTSNTILDKLDPLRKNYYFVRIPYTWGWATWKRAWRKYDEKLSSWPKLKAHHYLNKLFENKNVVSFYSHYFEYAHSGKSSAWDIRWFFSSLSNNMLCVIPPRNLISNVGFIGEHSRKKGILNDFPTFTVSTKNIIKRTDIDVDIDMEKNLFSSTQIDTFSFRRFVVELLILTKLDRIVRYIYKMLKLRI